MDARIPKGCVGERGVGWRWGGKGRREREGVVVLSATSFDESDAIPLKCQPAAVEVQDEHTRGSVILAGCDLK